MAVCKPIHTTTAHSSRIYPAYYRTVKVRRRRTNRVLSAQQIQVGHDCTCSTPHRTHRPLRCAVYLFDKLFTHCGLNLFFCCCFSLSGSSDRRPSSVDHARTYLRSTSWPSLRRCGGVGASDAAVYKFRFVFPIRATHFGVARLLGRPAALWGPRRGLN